MWGFTASPEIDVLNNFKVQCVAGEKLPFLACYQAIGECIWKLTSRLTFNNAETEQKPAST